MVTVRTARHGNTPMDRPPLPPFTLETAARKVRMAEDAWNSRDPARVALAYWHDDAGQWYRSYGNENWEFDDRSLRVPT